MPNLSGLPEGVGYVSTAMLRVQKDMNEMAYSRFSANASVRITFPEGHIANICRFQCVISPAEGLYQGAHFKFQFEIPERYPFEPPTVHCLSKVAHPCISVLSGTVHLAILRQHWKPVLSINAIVFALQVMLLEPDFSSPCPESFLHRLPAQSEEDTKRLIRRTLAGGWLGGVQWPGNGSGDQAEGGGGLGNPNRSNCRSGRGAGPAGRKRNWGATDDGDIEASSRHLQQLQLSDQLQAAAAANADEPMVLQSGSSPPPRSKRCRLMVMAVNEESPQPHQAEGQHSPLPPWPMQGKRLLHMNPQPASSSAPGLPKCPQCGFIRGSANCCVQRRVGGNFLGPPANNAFFSWPSADGPAPPLL